MRLREQQSALIGTIKKWVPLTSSWFVVFIFIAGTACNEKKNPLITDQEYVFSIPHVVEYDSSAKDQISYFKAEYITDASTFFISKYKFQDTVRIDNKSDRSSAYTNDIIRGDSTMLMKLRDSLTSDGLQVIPDYSLSIPVNGLLVSKNGYYYPVYVVNETNSDKLFTARDRYVSAIQEAKDRKGKWRPIESKKFDFIGYGKWGLVIHPYEYALFITAKYEGPYKTLIRVRMKIGDEIYLSKAFEGSINENQFHLQPDSYQYNEYKNDKEHSVSRRFLGSHPLDPDQK